MPCIVPPAASARLEYALGKLAAETALLNQRRMADADVVIIRPFNVAGPGQNAAGGFVLPRFLKHALAGMPLTVFGDGRAVRAFTHVADVVDGLLLAFDHGRSGQVYNLGNPANIVTIQQVAEAVLAAVGGGEIAYTDGVTLFGDLYAEANDKFPNADKAMHDLGWTPSRSLETIVQDTLAGLREELR
jgi:nucleoside-diphosphate-sugar epimerase